MESNPEIGRRVRCGPVDVNYHDIGSGPVLLCLHGSGPGVSAWANWRNAIESLKSTYRVLAPDFAGFGYSTKDEGQDYNRDLWVNQIIDLLDALGVENAHVLGNSFGGSIALALAIHHPERVNRLMLMGSVGVCFDLTPGLDAVWGYEPSVENMQRIMNIFSYDPALIDDELVRMRYEASVRPGIAEAFASMFPAPRQRWVQSMSHEEKDISEIRHRTLLIHGRDDRVIPYENSLRLHLLIRNSDLHLYGNCGHWSQIEKKEDFNQLIRRFLSGD